MRRNKDMARGKRRELTPDVIQQICAGIEAGNTRECACAAAGVSVQWFYDQAAKNGEFGAAIKKADALAEQHHVQVIQTSARRGNWLASAWWLERRRPQSWGRVDRMEITVRQQAAAVAAELGLTVNEVLAEADRIVRAASGESGDGV
jgi:hypothetical protein